MELRRDWNLGHKELTQILGTANEHARAIDLLLSLHAWLHNSKIGEGNSAPTYEEGVMDGLDEQTFRTYPAPTSDTRNSIAWHLWHSARIEDIAMNLLVADSPQVLDLGEWTARLGVSERHSGNDMTEQEVAKLSKEISMEGLLAYRTAVGIRTREIVQSLTPEMLKRKMQPADMARVEKADALNVGSKWLGEYWSKKTAAGLLLMPATRHNFVHLNRSMRIKEKLQKLRK